ncbi:MAG TPA: hypothetical protein VJI74_02975 [Candidatus Paceibacterota bacterium]
MDRELFSEIQRLRAEREQTLERIRAIDTRIAKVQEGLRGRLRGGMTTGDRIRDFVIVQSGYREEEEERYRQIEEALEGRTGEFVLVQFWKYQRVVFHVVSRGPGEEIGRWEKLWLLGVLTDDRLVLKLQPATCFLPTTKRVRIHDPKGPWEQENQPISEELMFGPNHFLLDSAPLPQGVGEHMTSRITVGDRNVKLWFEVKSTPEVYRKCAELLGKLILESESA